MVSQKLTILKFVITFWAAVVVPASGQGTLADYERSQRLAALTQNKVYRSSVTPNWSADGKRFWYRVDLNGGEREFISIDAVRGERSPAFDHNRLANALADLSKKAVSAKKLPIEQIELSPRSLRFKAFDRRYECDLSDYRLREADNGGAKGDAPKVAEESLVPLDTIRATRRTGPESSLVFVNKRRETLSLFWIDPDGERKSYGTVEAGRESRMSTFAGHVWLLVDPAKRPVAVFEAAEGNHRAIIDDRVKLNAEPAPKKRPSGSTSPDGTWRVVFQEHNVVLREIATNKETRLSKDGQDNNAYGGEVFWSPDSTRFVVLQTTKVESRKVNLVESSPKDGIYPKLHTINYAKPGDPLPVSRPHLFEIAGRREIPVSNELFANPWSLSHLRWDAAGREFSFLYIQRGHQTLRIVGIDGQSGQVRSIIDETSKTFVDYNGKFFYQDLDDAGEIVWMSERSGWNHLYLIDRKTGTVKNPITRGDWLVLGVDRVDVKNRVIYFRAGGIHPGQDPYHVHHARIRFDGTGLVILTEGDGTHTIAYSPDGRYFIDTYSRVDQAPITELRESDSGKLICPLERADIHELEKAGWQKPERFVAKARDGVTDIHGVIYRPTTFDAAKKYPVIEAIYAGPHGSFVPRGFRAFHSPQAIAELGFVVVQIDGMGTSHRSKAFHDVCWKNLGDSGFPDRILWIKAAAKKYGFMDLTRGVGIYGGSAGGQSALRALLAHGDFYFVAVADCGCHDNRIDKIWWNELWMGYPIGPHYAEQSNVTNAHKLTGKLLLTVGELDRNVDPASTMQVVDALVKSKKEFDLLVVPGAGHGVGESPYAARRRKDFFVRHLHGVSPPDWNRIEAKKQ